MEMLTERIEKPEKRGPSGSRHSAPRLRPLGQNLRSGDCSRGLAQLPAQGTTECTNSNDDDDGDERDEQRVLDGRCTTVIGNPTDNGTSAIPESKLGSDGETEDAHTFLLKKTAEVCRRPRLENLLSL